MTLQITSFGASLNFFYFLGKLSEHADKNKSTRIFWLVFSLVLITLIAVGGMGVAMSAYLVSDLSAVQLL